MIKEEMKIVEDFLKNCKEKAFTNIIDSELQLMNFYNYFFIFQEQFIINFMKKCIMVLRDLIEEQAK